MPSFAYSVSAGKGKQRRDLQFNSTKYYKAAKLFCEMNRYDDFLKQVKEDHKTNAQLAKSPLYLLFYISLLSENL